MDTVNSFHSFKKLFKCACLQSATNTYYESICLGGGGLVTKSCPTLATSWTVAHHAPLFMRFSRQEHWSGLPFLLQGIFPTQELNLGLLHCRQILSQLSYKGNPHNALDSGYTIVNRREFYPSRNLSLTMDDKETSKAIFLNYICYVKHPECIALCMVLIIQRRLMKYSCPQGTYRLIGEQDVST